MRCFLHRVRTIQLEYAVQRDTVRVAFIAALQHLPPRQRAVLILRDVLRWSAREVAGLLDTTVISVNSAPQRARATLAARRPTAGDVPTALSSEQRELLSRYLRAFESHDVDALVALLHHEATISMPPLPVWLRGTDRGSPVVGRPGARLPRLAAGRCARQPVARLRRLQAVSHLAWPRVVRDPRTRADRQSNRLDPDVRGRSTERVRSISPDVAVSLSSGSPPEGRPEARHFETKA